MRIKIITACLILSAMISSCIRDEALNTEAAIDGCTGPDIQQVTTVYNDDDNPFTIQLYVSKAADLEDLVINFQLPDGATIAPVDAETGDDAASSIYNFLIENPRKFKVTSEDKKYESVYTITVWQTEMPDSYHFETLSSESPYNVFYEQDNSEGTEGEYIIRRLEWASGNPGFNLTAEAKTPTDFPTAQSSGGINGGKCLKLVTRSTGSFGTMVGMPLAAGNLFIGSFDKSSALSNAMGATHFGFPYFHNPVTLEGYYKYKAGDQFTSGGSVVDGKVDNCDIYGVLYETDDEVSFLDGSNSLTSPNIVALARMQNGYLPETDTWTTFSFPFVLQNGKTIDSEKLAKGIYKLAVVFSSSVEGAKFNGAVGSTLYVDEVKVVSTELQ